ncbi:CRUM1 protein, partial [Amia calva]|nr:CRUM1 protein [Amia calva]
MIDDYFCHCANEPIKYMGKNCEELYDACSLQVCPAYSNCTSTPGSAEYICSCPVGFTGPNCTTNTNEWSDCLARITNCSDVPCHHNGTCIDLDGRYLCQCLPGFRRDYCEENINECEPMPCKNGAICLDGMNEYHCFCVPGFQGNNCEIDINECASRPCENNGTCINEKDRYVCECRLGYTGVNCEVEINECESSPCQHGATCQDYVGRYTCMCLAGYEGLDCEVDINECASEPCHNGGVCHDLVNGYGCSCADTGFEGDNCEIDIPECASNPCQNDGTCIDGVKLYSCLCWSGYEGQYCEVDINECAAEPCENHGMCYERSQHAYYSTLPDFPREFSYSVAAGYVCHCLPGFTGENCSVDIDECASMPCQNGGTCEDLINGYTCHCEPGYRGAGCETNIDECEGNPCQNGGTCEDGIAEHKCHCPLAEKDAIPWGGRDCEIQLVGCTGNECQNGATCTPTLVEGYHDYTCQCPPGFYGQYCNITTTFSFNSVGFILINASESNRSKRDVGSEGLSISLRFRTTLPDMIIFYRGNELDFLFLELISGQIHVKSRVETVTLHAQLSHQVNDGKWHEVTVRLRTDLVVTLKDPNCGSDICTAKDIGPEQQSYKTPRSFKKTFVGGVGSELYLNNTGSKSGFIGCMEDLLIDSLLVLPQDISKGLATDMELGCNKTELCAPNLCLNNGTCVDLWSTFQCHCSRPFHGERCLDEYTPLTFSREDSSSYASFNVSHSYGSTFNVSFFWRSRKESGLMFQLRNDQSAYFTVYLDMGRIYVQTLSTLALSVNPLYSTTGGKQWLMVTFNYGNISFSTSHYDNIQMEVVPNVQVQAGDLAFVGGLLWENETQPWGGYFKGCLQDVRLNNTRLAFENASSSSSEVYSILQDKDVTVGCVSDDTCQATPCENGGTCNVTWNDYVCSCPENFTGRNCERRVWCSSKPCPPNSQCLNLPDGYECVTTATFKGESPIKYTANMTLSRPITSISLDVRTRDEDAVLLRATNGVELFCVGLHNSTLVVKLRTGNNFEILSLFSEFPISDGLWHKVLVSMAEPYLGSSKWMIVVDDEKNTSSLDVAGNLNFLNESVVSLAENFTGCLGRVRVGGVHLPFIDNDMAPQQARFIKRSGEEIQTGCMGSPVCSSQPCLNNGVCEDLFNFFECRCSLGWEGQYCQYDIDDCQSSPCLYGNCSNFPGTYECECYPGYTGRTCAVDIDDCLDHHCANGGTCNDGVDSYTCTCSPDYTGHLCEWSYPPLACEKDVLCQNHGICNDGLWGANCTCTPGFTGQRCEIDIDECAANPCQNGGTCKNYVNKFDCTCLPNFVGQQCETNKQEQKERIPLLVIAIPVACGCVLLVIIGLIFMVLTARKKRQSEGTYSPSQQEVAGARLEMDSVLKVPPEERLI